MNKTGLKINGRKWQPLLALSVAFYLLPSLSFAAFEDLGAGARAPGMGNAFTAVADDIYAIYYNPAGLGGLDRPQMAASFSKVALKFTDDSDISLSHLAYAKPLRNGKLGTVGLGWQRFALSQLYSESTVSLSYGSRARVTRFGKLHMGLNVKFLSRGFSTPPEAANACQDTLCNLGADPVLSGTSGMSALDADIGFLLRTDNRLSFGLVINHILSPNVAFDSNDSEKLAMGLRFGAAYKSLWQTISTEIRFREAPDGSQDKILTLAGERFIPIVNAGQFGVRGAFTVGNRDIRQASLGFTYRINKIQVDYAMIIPFGLFSDTLGSHRVGLTFHFGAPRTEDQYARELFEHLHAADKKTGYAYEFEGMKSLAEKEEALVVLIQHNLSRGRYSKALSYLEDIAEVQDKSLLSLKDRLAIVVKWFPDLISRELKWEQTLYAGIGDFLSSRPGPAVQKIAFAHSLHPASPQVEGLLLDVEGKTGFSGRRLKEEFRGIFSLVEESLVRSDFALKDGDMDETIRLCKEVLTYDPKNPAALGRMGTAYYLKKDMVKALWAWEQAILHEQNEDERRIITRAVNRLRRSNVLPLPTPNFLSESGRAGKRAKRRRPVKKVKAPVRKRKRATSRNTDVLDKIYLDGVEQYMRQQYGDAQKAFQRVLKLDPNYSRARKALDRITKDTQ